MANLAILASVGGAVRVGDTATVPDHQWVKVKNPNPLHNSNGVPISFGRTCSVQRGGLVRAVAVSPSGIVLAEYAAPGNEAYGAQCASGTVFLVPAEEFSTMTERFEAAEQAENAEREAIRALLGR
jgi:hypothetical protein